MFTSRLCTCCSPNLENPLTPSWLYSRSPTHLSELSLKMATSWPPFLTTPPPSLDPRPVSPQPSFCCLCHRPRHTVLSSTSPLKRRQLCRLSAHPPPPGLAHRRHAVSMESMLNDSTLEMK